MKAKYVLLLLFFLIKLCHAQDKKSNYILNDTIWASDTVKIYNDLIVAHGTTLTIDPGVYVEYQGNYSLTVYGCIKAIGTQLDSITFTIHDTTSFGDTSTLAGGWGSIKLLNNPIDTSFFSYCVFSYGKAVDPGHSVYGNFNENFMGGAIFAYHYANLNCINTTFFHNRAIEYGGGIWVKYFATLEFSNNLFKKNNSFFEGGGIKIESGTSANISRNRFIDNIAFNDGYTEWGHWVAGAGGGIYIGVNSNAVVMNNWFCNNTAANGSIYETDYNCVVYNNIIANNMGIGLFNGDEIGTPKYINNTIVNNLAWSFESGIFSFSRYTKMINNIVYGNKTTDSLLMDPIQVYTMSPNKADFAYGCNPDEPIYYEGEGNIHDNPMFVNPTAGAGPDYDGMAADWSLQDGSPCVNTGTPDTTDLNLPEFDIAGNPRLYGIRIDMGAYENQVVVGLPTNPLVNAKLEIAPNPFKDRFSINLFGENKVKRIQLVNQSGITVKTLEHFPAEGLMMIDLNGFSSGLYLVVVEFADGTRRIEKVLKE